MRNAEQSDNWKQRFYDSYVSSGQAAGDKSGPLLKSIIKKHLPKTYDISIADLACGHGPLVRNLKELGFTNVCGVDISREQVDRAHRAGIAEVKCQDIHDFLRDNESNRFDVIFLMDILEHLDKAEVVEMLDKVNAALKDDGVVVIHVPNAAGIFGMRIRYGDFTHETAFTARSIQQVLRVCSFQGVKCYEDKPVIHGLKSLARFVLWQVLTAPMRLLLVAETGVTNHIVSQNMLVIAEKSA